MTLKTNKLTSCHWLYGDCHCQVRTSTSPCWVTAHNGEGWMPRDQLSAYVSLANQVGLSMTIFNTSEYKDNMGPEKRDGWPPVCHCRACRNGPDSENPYDITQQFWHVFAARLAFILIFEHVVFLLTGAIAMAFPDIPVEVRNQMKREKKVEKETLFENEMRKIRQGRQASSPDDDTNHLGEGLTTTANSRRGSPSASVR